MIISGKQVQNLLRIYGKTVNTDGVKPKAETAAPRRAPDAVSISGEGKLKQKALQAAYQAEDVRGDRVDDIRQAITAGTYNVSEEEVAEKMIYRALVDKLV